MKIFVTRRIPKEGLKLLEKEYELEINPHNRVLKKQEIINGLNGKDGLICLLTDVIDKEVIISEPKLKMIASYAAGFDNIDIKIATEKKIPVSNTPEVLTEATSDMAWALLFSVARRLIEGDNLIRTGGFKGWDPMLMIGQDVTGKTLGIVGAGRIGTAFALKSKGFNMNVLYFDSKVNDELEQHLNAQKVDLPVLLQESDFISLHVPLTIDTHHLIGEKELKMMKKTAILINTSRGPVVDEQALAQSLKKKWIFGAGLDVYEHEPLIYEELKKLQNIVLQPHSASATVKSRTQMAIMVAKNMIEGLHGRIPPNCVNVEVFKK
jgi:glyoxylate reductase